eukprot:scaffold238404_cov30-Tisochrysis_lutea.AAC.2
MSSSGAAHLAFPAVRSDRFINKAVPYSIEYWHKSSRFDNTPTSQAITSELIITFWGARRRESFCRAPRVFWRAMLSDGSTRNRVQSWRTTSCLESKYVRPAASDAKRLIRRRACSRNSGLIAVSCGSSSDANTSSCNKSF